MLTKDYSAYSESFMNMCTQSVGMWGGHHGSTKVRQDRIELENTNRRPTCSVPYLSAPKARDLEKQEINGMLSMEVIEPA